MVGRYTVAMASKAQQADKKHDHGTIHLGYQKTSQVTGLPVGTLYWLVARRQIPHVRLGPRLVRFPLDDLLAWLEEHRVPLSKGDPAEGDS
jgi:excisionase family DNA binding protein